jgi:hypothetical protein
MFETEDLVLRKNEKNFILTLLEVARRGAKFGMAAPTIIKMELEIEREMMVDRGEIAPEEYHAEDEAEEYIEPQKITIDFQSLDEMVLMIILPLKQLFFEKFSSHRKFIKIYKKLIINIYIYSNKINFQKCSQKFFKLFYYPEYFCFLLRITQKKFRINFFYFVIGFLKCGQKLFVFKVSSRYKIRFMTKI